jgi:lipopolysaccharide transport system permease protein
MRERVFSAAPERLRARAFAAAAWEGLSLAFRIAPRLFRANLRIRYRRSPLGALWLLMPAAGAALVSSQIVGGRTGAVPGLDLPYPAFVLVGIILWQLLVETVQAPLQQLNAARHIVSRTPVPHEAFVLAGVFEALLACALRLLLLALPVLLLVGASPGPALLMLPLTLAALAMLGLGLGLLVAPLGLLYDEVQPALSLFIALGLFLSPVLYPATKFRALAFNPVTPLIEASRNLLTGRPAPLAEAALVGAASMLLLAFAWLFYRLAQSHVVARLG